jgi:hypothetical protein
MSVPPGTHSRVPDECSEAQPSGTRAGTQRENREAPYWTEMRSTPCGPGSRLSLRSAGTREGISPRVSGIRLALRCAVLVFFVLDRNRVDPAEPAVEIDVGAAPGAERPELGH